MISIQFKGLNNSLADSQQVLQSVHPGSPRQFKDIKTVNSRQFTVHKIGNPRKFIYSPRDCQTQTIYRPQDSQSRQFKSLQDCHSQKIYSLQDCSSPAITGPHDYLGSRITLIIPGDYYCPRQSTVRKTVNPCTNNCSKIKYCRTRLPILGKFWLKEQQIFLRTVDLRNAHDQIPVVAPLVITQDCFNPRTCTGPLMSYVEMKHR